MRRREFTPLLLAWTTIGVPVAQAAGLTETEAASGVRAALERGALSAVSLLGRNDGFLGNPKVRIPLPGVLKDAVRLLKATGQQKKVDELVLAMNRAAEAAVPDAKTLLVQAVKAMSVEDALKIVRGPDNAVSAFFEGKTRSALSDKFLPIVTHATERVALAEKFNAVAGKAAKMDLLKGDDAYIPRYVTGKSLDGLYLMIGEEERRIRRDPVGTGSDILRKVFGR